MIEMSIPNELLPEPTVMVVAQSEQPYSTSQTKAHVLGVCRVFDTAKLSSTGIHPVVDANAYLGLVFNARQKDGVDWETASVKVLVKPHLGSLELSPNGRDMRYEPDHLGEDHFVLEVTGSGKSVKIHYFFGVTDEPLTTPNVQCPAPYWKISIPATPLDPTSLQRLKIKGARLN